MKKNMLFYVLLTGVSVCSCEQAHNEQVSNDSMLLSLEAQVGNPIIGINVRGDGSENTGNYFQKNDAIGLFMEDDAAVKWIKSDTGWEGEVKMYWPTKTDSYQFYAFSPYVSCNDKESVPMPSLQEQTGRLGRNVDFLVADILQNYGENGTVSFTDDHCFTHVSCLLSLTFLGMDSMEDAEFTKLILSGKDIATASTYSFLSKTVTLKDDDKSDEVIITNTPDATEEGVTYDIIVNAFQTSNVIGLTIEYTVDGEKYRASLDELTSTLRSGYQQKYTIEIKGVELVISGAEVAPWTDGGNITITVDGEKVSV